MCVQQEAVTGKQLVCTLTMCEQKCQVFRDTFSENKSELNLNTLFCVKNTA